MHAIANHNVYVNRMSKSIEDKTDYILQYGKDVTLFVDFGCADGALIEYLALHPDINPAARFLGYDEDKDMILDAKSNHQLPNIALSSNWEFVLRAIDHHKRTKKGKIAVIFSSVIHEILNYQTETILADILRDLDNVDYIFIRDMYDANTYNYRVPAEFLNKVFAEPELEDMWTDYVQKKLGDFQFRTFIHYEEFLDFLLKIDYKDNWDREVKEWYLGLNPDILHYFTKDEKYYAAFQQIYTLPYFREKIQNRFGFDLRVPTHIKLVLRKIDY